MRPGAVFLRGPKGSIPICSQIDAGNPSPQAINHYQHPAAALTEHADLFQGETGWQTLPSGKTQTKLPQARFRPAWRLAIARSL